jgi:hypothetical protein
MNAVPKQRKKREAWLKEFGRRFDFVMVPLPRVHPVDQPALYHPALKKALVRGDHFVSLGHVPVTAKTVVFLVRRTLKKGVEHWSSPELRVQSKRKDGLILWRRVPQ